MALPYQPNPGLPNYNPNPAGDDPNAQPRSMFGSAGGDPVAGYIGNTIVPAVQHAFSSPDPLVQMPSAPVQAQEPIDPNASARPEYGVELGVQKTPIDIAPPITQAPQPDAQLAGPPSPPGMGAKAIPGPSSGNLGASPRPPAGPGYVNDQDAVAMGAGIPSLPGPAPDPYAAYSPTVRKQMVQEEKRHAAATEARDKANAATIDRMNGQAEALQQQADGQVMADSIEQATMARNRENQARRLKEHRDRVAEIERLGDEAANAKLDSGHFWANKSTPEKIFAAMAVFGSGFASGGAGPNVALQTINHAIERDIDSQKFNINQKWKRVDAKRGVLHEMRALWGDEDVADLATLEYAKRQGASTLERLKTQHMADDKLKAINEVQADLLAAAEKAKADRADLLQSKNDSQAAQAAAAQAAEAKKQREFYRTRYLKYKDTDGLSDAEASARAMADVGGGGEFRGLPTEEERKANAKGGANAEAEERIMALQAGAKAVDTEIAKYAKGRPGDITSKVPSLSHVPGTDAMKHRIELDDWNARATLLLGPVVEAMNKGKPGAVELRTLQEEVHVGPYMSEDEKVARMRRLQALQKDAAAIYQRELKTTQGKPGEQTASNWKPPTAATERK